jgi:hypothetical protein
VPIELAQELHERANRPSRLELARDLLSRVRATLPAAAGPSKMAGLAFRPWARRVPRSFRGCGRGSARRNRLPPVGLLRRPLGPSAPASRPGVAGGSPPPSLAPKMGQMRFDPIRFDPQKIAAQGTGGRSSPCACPKPQKRVKVRILRLARLMFGFGHEATLQEMAKRGAGGGWQRRAYA